MTASDEIGLKGLNQCQHGSLRHKCEICERDHEIERLRAELATERGRSSNLDAATESWERMYGQVRQRAQRAEAACAAKDEKINAAITNLESLAEIHALGIDKDWGLQCSAQAQSLRTVLSPDAGRAYAERAEKYREALRLADQFITNGIELGYIRMPDADTPDTARDTPRIVREALQETDDDDA